jgi:hypothetical protein
MAKKIGLMVLVLSFIVASASATLLVPGGVLPANPEPDPVGGGVVFTTGPVPVVAATFTGQLISNVIAGDATNPFGGLTFTYQISNLPNSFDAIERLTVNDFAGFLTDASFQPAGGIAPVFITRSINGNVVGFNFMAPALLQGASSELLVVQTNAPQWKLTTASVINGSVAMVDSVAPMIPEPCTLALLALGGLASWRKRRV